MAIPDQLQKGFTYADGDVVNAAGLNALVDQAEVLKGIITEQGAPVAAVGTDYVLITDTSDSDNLKRALVSSLPGVGTVTSVAFDSGYPAPLTVFDGSVQTGTAAAKIRLSLNNQTAGKILAGPVSGSAATPSFRVLSPVDMPFATSAIAASSIDWNLGVMFSKTLPPGPGNTAFTFTGASHGQTIRVLLAQDTPGTRTVSWPATVKWPDGGTAPVMTTGAGARDIYTFHFITGLYFGTVEQEFV